MASFEKGNKIGNRFTSANQPKNSGRKPSLYKKLKELTGLRVEYELSKEDYFKLIRFVMERTPNEIEKLIKNPDGTQNKDIPIWVINIISAINMDIRYGRTSTMDSIFDRVFGKAIQSIEADISTSPKMEGMSEEHILAEIARIDKELGV